MVVRIATAMKAGVNSLVAQKGTSSREVYASFMFWRVISKLRIKLTIMSLTVVLTHYLLAGGQETGSRTWPRKGFLIQTRPDKIILIGYMKVEYGYVE